MKRLGILISGRGSNFEAIADKIDAGALDARVAVVIANRPEARGLEIARQRGLQRCLDPIQRPRPRSLRSHAPCRTG